MPYYAMNFEMTWAFLVGLMQNCSSHCPTELACPGCEAAGFFDSKVARYSQG